MQAPFKKFNIGCNRKGADYPNYHWVR